MRWSSKGLKAPDLQKAHINGQTVDERIVNENPLISCSLAYCFLHLPLVLKPSSHDQFDTQETSARCLRNTWAERSLLVSHHRRCRPPSQSVSRSPAS